MLDRRQAMLVDDARAAAPAGPTRPPRPDAATVAAATAAAKAAVKPLVVLHARFEQAMLHFRVAAARVVIDTMLAAVEAALPDDSLVLVHTLHQLVTAYSTPLDQLTPWAAGGTGAVLGAQHEACKAAWRDDPEHTLVPARRAVGILRARAAAGTLLRMSPEELAFIQLGDIGAASSFALLIIAVDFMSDSWPPELRDSEEGTALLALALDTLVEGGTSEYSAVLTCSTAELMCFENTCGTLVRGLFYDALEDAGIAQRARACGVDRAALRELLKRYAATPDILAGEHEMMAAALEAEVASRLRRQSGQLRTCGRTACGAVEVRAGQFKLCGACRGAVYCGADCQTADWPSHKAACKAARKAQAAGDA
jgi:hypothetical protein